MYDAVDAVEVSLAILVLGSLVSLAASSRPRVCGWVSFAIVAASAIPAWLAVAASSGAAPGRTLLSIPQLGGGFTFRVDPLSAVFLGIVALVSPAATLYSIRYMEHYKSDKAAKFYPVLLLSIAAMMGVVISADLLCFLVFWEAMTLTSYFLVIYERESAATQRAGLKYFIVTHAATLLMVAGALLVWRASGSFHFDSVRQTLSSLAATRPFESQLITFLFFIGFATKAGLLPMGDWLPDAHPVAPSGMSAMLSGALVKLGIYGLMRLFCSFLAPSPSLVSWGILVALAGAASLFIANLTALSQSDIKRLMAFSTIGQIGYICLGLGTGVYCLAAGSPSLAAICLAGALLHAINHACFKSCLFLGAGSVLYRMGTRDMNQLGGLAHFMPYTAGSTIVASLSIAGVPPLNGFTSKWLIIAGCILAGLRFPLFLVLGVVALFISVVSLASFLKVAGGVFLGAPDENVRASEAPMSMIVPQAVLAALCVVLGIFPQAALHFVRPAIESVSGIHAGAISGSTWSGILLMDGSAVGFWGPLAILLGLGACTAIGYGLQRMIRPHRRQVPAWYCGEPHAASAVRYRAGSLFQPFRRAFDGIYPAAKLRSPHFPALLRRWLDFDRWFYMPAAHGVERAAGVVSRTHVGTPQVYLLWIVIGAIAVVAITLVAAL